MKHTLLLLTRTVQNNNVLPTPLTETSPTCPTPSSTIEASGSDAASPNLREETQVGDCSDIDALWLGGERRGGSRRETSRGVCGQSCAREQKGAGRKGAVSFQEKDLRDNLWTLRRSRLGRVRRASSGTVLCPQTSVPLHSFVWCVWNAIHVMCVARVLVRLLATARPEGLRACVRTAKIIYPTYLGSTHDPLPLPLPAR